MHQCLVNIGYKNDGLMKTTLDDGFSGIVVIIYEGEFLKKIKDKYEDEKLSNVMFLQLKKTVIKMIIIVEENKDRLYCIGLMIQDSTS